MHKIVDGEIFCKEFNNILEDAETPLQDGCIRPNKLSTLVTLYNIKAKFGLSDKCCKEVLSVIGEMLPQDHRLLNSNMR